MPIPVTDPRLADEQAKSAWEVRLTYDPMFVELQYAKRKLISEQFLPHRKDCYEILLSLDERAIDVHC